MAKTRWSRQAPRTRDVNWTEVWQQQQDRLRKAERDPIVLVYAICHNPRTVKCAVENAVIPLLSTLVHARHHLRRVYDGHVGKPVFVGTIAGTAVYEVHCMYRLSPADMLAIGFDQIDAHYAQQCEYAGCDDYTASTRSERWAQDLSALCERFCAA